jgi:hypothetical protein
MHVGPSAKQVAKSLSMFDLCTLQFPVKPGEPSQPLAPWVTRFEFNPTTKKACITFAVSSPDTVFYQVQYSAGAGHWCCTACQ